MRLRNNRSTTGFRKTVTDPERQNPDYFEQKAAELPLDRDYTDRLTDLYWEKQMCHQDLWRKRDDNLVRHDSRAWLPEIDMSKPRLAYRKVDALKDAPDPVKRVFSIEFGERRDLTAAWKDAIIGQLQKHPLDSRSLEARIARSTTLIRHWTLLLEELKPGRQSLWLKKMLHNTVEQRRKMLRLLRQEDYEAFEKLLNQLKIAYHVPPLPEDEPLKSRKAWSETQIRKRVEAEKEKRLADFYALLLSRRERFLEVRDRRLQELDAEESDLRTKLEQLTTNDGAVLNVQGKYWGRTVDSVAEDLSHGMFYHEHGTKKFVPPPAGRTSFERG